MTQDRLETIRKMRPPFWEVSLFSLEPGQPLMIETIVCFSDRIPNDVADESPDISGVEDGRWGRARYGRRQGQPLSLARVLRRIKGNFDERIFSQLDMLDSSFAARASRKPLRIAQIAPLYESVPPKLYGGTERVIAWLSEALARRGHRVTLFASGDSSAQVPLEAGFPQALRLAGLEELGPAYHLPMLSDVYDRADEFDLIHSHLEHLGFPFAHLAAVPTISTMHGRVDLEDFKPIYDRYADLPLVSSSQSQSDLLPDMNWVDTVYHGLPPTSFHLNPNPGRYLAFLGRLSPEKRPEIAIEASRRTGIPLKIAAKVDRNNEAYFNAVIKPLLSSSTIEYVGEIGESQKQEFLGNAIALLFPIDWPEPFGLVMIEALACGTPVIARPFGSVPEILRHGISGFIESDIDGLVNAVHRVSSLSRHACREEFEARFTADIMAMRYESLYYNLIRREQVHSENLSDPGLASAAK